MNYIEKAREVLKIEIEGIQKISQDLNGDFENLIKLCLETLNKDAKLVLSGVGKSGQIAQKLASTLSSTGSRATYLHPVEAMHGDLGILYKDDIFIALSYSGETDELLTALPAVRRLGNKIVAFTGKRDSTLVKMSDAQLISEIEQEACPFNLAPTTTTTAMLALGDALAMVLMEARQFDIRSYGSLHPSGAIGRSITLTVADVMRTGDALAEVHKSATVMDAVVAMTASKGGTTAIVDCDHKLLGIFTTGDLKRGLTTDPSFLDQNIEQFMILKPSTIKANQLAVDVLKILEQKKINAIPVIDSHEKFVGLIDIQDLPKFKVV